MRTASFLTVLSVLILSFAVSTSAQRTRRKPAPRPTPTPVKASPIIAAAKQQVSNQLYNVNVFVDKMGPIAVAIEKADKDAAARKLKKEAIDANEANKKKLIAAIRGLRDGLVTLETDFRTKTQLTPYLAKIQGISTLCAQSEDSAIAGRFVASKDPLRQVALKLNETLAVLPGGVAPTRAEAYPPATTTTNQTKTIPVSAKSTPVSPPPSTLDNRVAPPVQAASTVKRDVSEGMTASEVLQSAWGAPSSKRSSTSANGTTEVWLYSGNRSIYFFNGKVTQIVK
jgi:hypothetical protein